MIEIARTFTFDAAHFLPNVPTGHKCGRMHGHTYKVVLCLTGDIDPNAGWVRDFGDLKLAFQSVESELDHRLLNEVPGLQNPTSEHLAVWLWDRLLPELPEMSSVSVSETPTSRVTYRGEQR